MPFSRQTTCDWALQLAELCRPLYELMIAEVLASGVLHTDDTPVKVRDAHGKRQYTGRFWNYVGDDEHPLSVFTCMPSRSRDGPGGPAEFLKDYRGYLQADAFAGYDALYLGPDARIVEVACWAHAGTCPASAPVRLSADRGAIATRAVEGERRAGVSPVA